MACATPASRRPAAKAASKQTAAEAENGHADHDGPETEDMFGFTIGTDILEKGHVELSTEAVGSFGKRGGRYRVGSFKNAFAFAPVRA